MKIHFVLVDFADGNYTRHDALQYDGMTGLQSPQPRSARTGDRSLVAREATHLVLQDFGLVGTVQKAGKEIHLALKGGKIGVALERSVKIGDQF